MKATYGFRATMTARPGMGDELIDLLLSAPLDHAGGARRELRERTVQGICRTDCSAP